ncbi:hypothetical protein SKAU_G00389010 [Synaphobranchus kaupii]|uniref:Uncharacterized protein n=1 Tax=Synaphobranchus kaupii TaxID=118154 RepID=A0A9Q1EB53_SYNKA|nr:hypothetical protein SKAU_G00389010 [Synaphobranchus kaupii]
MVVRREEKSGQKFDVLPRVSPKRSKRAARGRVGSLRFPRFPHLKRKQRSCLSYLSSDKDIADDTVQGTDMAAMTFYSANRKSESLNRSEIAANRRAMSPPLPRRQGEAAVRPAFSAKPNQQARQSRELRLHNKRSRTRGLQTEPK